MASLASALDEILDDLSQFINQSKTPAKAALEDKLKQIYRDIAKAAGRPVTTPIKRAAEFGSRRKGATQSSASKRTELNLTIETPVKDDNNDGNESDDSVPNLEDFLINTTQPNPVQTTTTTVITSPRRTKQSTTKGTQITPKAVNDQDRPQQHEPSGNATQHGYGTTKKHCLILSDSSFRVISAFLCATHNKLTNTITNFTCHAIGGTTITNLTAAIHEGLPVNATDHLILHVGVNDVSSAERCPDPQVLKREYLRLLSIASDKFPKSTISLSHVFPIKTADMRVRRNVQMANSAIDAAAAETRGVKVVNFGAHLLIGDRLRAHMYENGCHLNPKGGLFVAFRVKEHFGFQSREHRPQRQFNSAKNFNQHPHTNQQHRNFNNYQRQQTPHRPPPSNNVWHQSASGRPGIGYHNTILPNRPAQHAQPQHNYSETPYRRYNNTESIYPGLGYNSNQQTSRNIEPPKRDDYTEPRDNSQRQHTTVSGDDRMKALRETLTTFSATMVGLFGGS
jgi:hypothetical protein